ncbi:BofC C-terminal domain-containing protein [Sporomusa malonica]|uniref:BofC C-terminal domain-containing protein n=1 Tax=Sporomusa malonica TaxID=112901 RepID=A0A1W2AH92_9FIRM|nr:BofC C-terminal domain-containing protein [Sporomusa malonica]SMC59983.1 BofC C-terminal domain-containing protein [Sporomusa malonica]
MLSKFIAKLFSLHQNKLFAKLRPVVIGGLILLLSGIGYYSFHSNDEVKRPVPQQESEVVKQDGKIKISANTNVVQKIIYTKCNDEETFRTKPPDNLVGLNFNQVQKIYSGWSIEKFDTKEVEMTLKVDSLCREHANNMFIGIKDGYVAVFYGVPGTKAIVKEVTKISVNGLMPQDVQELHQGLVVQSKEELLKTLEGMQAR